MSSASKASKVEVDDEPLAPEEVVDERDVSPRLVAPTTQGHRVRAFPSQGGTTVEIRSSDFALGGIEHPDVSWDFRVNKFTVPVGEDGISQEAADWLTSSFPASFAFTDEGEPEVEESEG